MYYKIIEDFNSNSSNVNLEKIINNKLYEIIKILEFNNYDTQKML